MKNLNFPYPFSFFRGLDFTNCFASLYMYLEKYQGNNEYDCAKNNNKPCNGCGRCRGTLSDKQTFLFFLFDTVSGRSATVWGWENKPTKIHQEIYDSDDMVEYLFGFTGYGYDKHIDNIIDRIKESINKDIPVLARMKNSGHNTFRIITGFDGDSLLQARPDGGQRIPDEEPILDNIDSIYVVTGKTERKYTLIDGLKRIKHVFESDHDEGIWDKYINSFNNYWGEMVNVDLEEIKKRFKYAEKAMMWNCHNFAEVFRIYREYEKHPEMYSNDIWNELKDKRIAAACEKIDDAYDDSHKRQWQVAALSGTRDWSKRFFNEWEWGMCECAADALRIIKKDDETVYEAVCEMINIIEDSK